MIGLGFRGPLFSEQIDPWAAVFAVSILVLMAVVGWILARLEVFSFGSKLNRERRELGLPPDEEGGAAP